MSVNKVLNNIPQSLTNAEKTQARTNIDAARTVSVVVPGTTGWSGDLRFQYNSTNQTYDTYIDTNDIGTIIPSPTLSGTYVTCDENGTVTWTELPTPKRDVFMESQYYDITNVSTNVEILRTIQLPTHNGKYPTKIIGSFYCNPKDDCTSLSVVPCASCVYQEDTYNITPYESSQNLNVNNLLALTDGDAGEYSNTVSFQFHKNPMYAGNDKEITWIAIKGMSGHPGDYHIHNINMTYFYESEE